MRAATETVIKLLGRTNRKTRRFFIMEGAQTHKVCAALLELDVLTHHIDNVDAGEQVLNKGLRYQKKSQPKQSKYVVTPNQRGASAALTNAETTVISARPANLGLSTAINLPISCGPVAPVSATAAATAACISASDNPAGI